MSTPLLQSWKEIALYLQVGVRTAQRWENSLALPVHHTGIKGRVFAVREELDGWLQSCPKRNHSELELDLLDQISETFYAVDSDWRFVYVNSAAARAWNVTRNELIGKRLWEALPQLDGTEIKQSLAGVIAHGSRATFETYSPVLKQSIEVVAYPLRNGGLAVSFREAGAHRVKAKHQTGSAA